jgi:hypothetical protein
MDFYFAHISYSDVRKDGNDPLVFREGSLMPELAVLNLPLGPGDTIALRAYARDTDFELWNESMNEDFVAMHKGVTFIPDPIYKYPEAVIYFAQKYSNIHGEWKLERF